MTINASCLTEREFSYFLPIMREMIKTYPTTNNKIFDFVNIVALLRNSQYRIFRDIGIKIKYANMEDIIYSSFSKN